jgi:adenylate cyclase class 1
MTSITKITNSAGEYDVRAVRKRFLSINRERLRRTEEALRWRTRDFLDLLPLLFHVNHTMLPGYVSKETPVGVAEWEITKKSLDAGKRIAKAFEYKKRALSSFDIHSIFLIGSVGTIAHSEQSDFDIWVCHRPDLTRQQKVDLQAKCQGIEQWADSLDLEVHFFLMNADEFRSGKVVELSSESSGSTQHHLLLEEFYRTGLLVAGRYPVWWLVPPDEEVNYDKYVERLIKQRFVPEYEVIDFGGLAEIPAEEFFGAAVWQVYKGIDSPYKSVLKMLLMEAYAAEYPHSDLLSLRYKRAIYDGVTDLDLLDPYSILQDKLESYLKHRSEPERLDLIRRCFYFKMDLPLSRASKTVQNWRVSRIRELVALWEWDDAKIETLDNHADWNVHKVLKERRILVDEITHSYMALSKFARTTASLARIEQRDLNILGRKLYAAFERKAGKIETINRGISSNIVESQVTLLQGRGRDNEELWSLYPNPVGEIETNRSLKRSRSVVELLAWCHFNRLINERTIISVVVNSGVLSFREVNSILATLNNMFPKGKLPYAQIENFAMPPVISSGCVFANVGVDPMANLSFGGAALVSEQSDIMNYSGFSLNLAQSFDLVVVTSWQEIITYKYTGVQGLLDCLAQYLRWGSTEEVQNPPPPLKAYSFSSSHSNAVARRIEELYEDLAACIFKPETVRYILQVEQSYYLIELGNGKMSYTWHEGYDNLLEVLGEPRARNTTIQVDRNALQKTPLPAILAANRPGCIQMYYLPVGAEVDVYVLDENGSLFHQRVPYYDDAALVSQYSRFFDAILTRHNFLFQDESAGAMLQSLQIYKAVLRQGGKFGFEPQDKEVEGRGSYFSVQVIGDVIEQSTAFTIYCNDREFSSLDYGKDLFREVARYVFLERRSRQRYPIYITDVDLSPSLMGDSGRKKVQAIDYLKYKKRIEVKLNGELQKL